jgi:hypothetical protein
LATVGESLQRALRSLTDAELLYVRGIAPEATYQFKHALIRDAAYEALLKSRRKELHLSVARSRRRIPKSSRATGLRRAKPTAQSANGKRRESVRSNAALIAKQSSTTAKR